MYRAQWRKRSSDLQLQVRLQIQQCENTVESKNITLKKKIDHKQNELKVYKVEVLTGSLLCCTKQIVNKD